MFLLLLLITFGSVVSAQSSKALPRLVVPTSPQPPPTVAEMVGQAHLIVHVRVRKKAVQGRDGGAPPRTALELSVVEVIKGEFPGDVLTVYAPGGTVRRDGIDVTTQMSEIAAVPIHSEAILFIRRAEGGGFVPEWGDAGAFELLRGEARVPRQVRHYPEFKGLWTVPARELISSFKQLSKRK